MFGDAIGATAICLWQGASAQGPGRTLAGWRVRRRASRALAGPSPWCVAGTDCMGIPLPIILLLYLFHVV